MQLFGALVPAEAAVLHRGVAEHGVEGVEAAGQVAASELLGREDGPARHPATTQHTHGYIRSLKVCQPVNEISRLSF